MGSWKYASIFVSRGWFSLIFPIFPAFHQFPRFSPFSLNFPDFFYFPPISLSFPQFLFCWPWCYPVNILKCSMMATWDVPHKSKCSNISGFFLTYSKKKKKSKLYGIFLSKWVVGSRVFLDQLVFEYEIKISVYVNYSFWMILLSLTVFEYIEFIILAAATDKMKMKTKKKIKKFIYSR